MNWLTTILGTGSPNWIAAYTLIVFAVAYGTAYIVLSRFVKRKTSSWKSREEKSRVILDQSWDQAREAINVSLNGDQYDWVWVAEGETAVLMILQKHPPSVSVDSETKP